MGRTTHVILCLAATVLAACSGGGNSDRWGARAEAKRVDPVVETLPVERANIANYERSTGRIEARNIASVYARVPEVAQSVNYDVGDLVEMGAELARLDNRKLKLEVAAADLAYLDAQLSYDKLVLESEKARADLARILKYLDPKNPETSRMFSKEDHAKAELELRKAENSVEAGSLAVDKNRVAMQVVQLKLSQSAITAPISGTITERNIRENELVAASSVVFKIADFSELEVRLDVAEAGLRGLHQPQRRPAIPLFGLREKVDLPTAQAAYLSVTAFPKRRFLGYVDRISPTVDPERGMVGVTVRIIQPSALDEEVHRVLLDQLDKDHRQAVLDTAVALRRAGGATVQLLPGMWVDARIAVDVRQNVLVVPSAALVGDSEVIWVVSMADGNARDGTGIVRRVEIKGRRGVSSGTNFELLPPPDATTAEAKGEAKALEIKAGDAIVVRGQSLLRDNQKVKTINLKN